LKTLLEDELGMEKYRKMKVATSKALARCLTDINLNAENINPYDAIMKELNLS